MNVFLILAIFPFALILVMIHEHYNWSSPRNGELVKKILLAIKMTIVVQVICLVIGAFVGLSQIASTI